MQNKASQNTTYLVHISATCFNQTWSPSGWPQERKDKYIHICIGIEISMPYICYYIKQLVCIYFYITTYVRHWDINPNTTVYIFPFFSCGQPDDDHVWSKHVADLRTKYTIVFWLDLFCIFDYKWSVPPFWVCSCHPQGTGFK
jgi:hypothetical protein